MGTSYFANKGNEYVMNDVSHVDDYVVEEAVEVYPEDWLKEAEEAKEAVLLRKTLEAESSRLEAEIEALVADMEAQVTALEEAKIIIDKKLNLYWKRKGNLQAEVRKVAEEYGVSAYTMGAIIGCESGWDYEVQSRHKYTATNAPSGYSIGDTEMSFGLVQIHVPVHDVTIEQARDPEFAIDFLAKNIAKGRASMWSCFTNNIAMR